MADDNPQFAGAHWPQILYVCTVYTSAVGIAPLLLLATAGLRGAGGSGATKIALDAQYRKHSRLFTVAPRQPSKPNLLLESWRTKVPRDAA
jgi:hypothetical protein